MKKGFTLAEILVTMMIIGIVASMTIPTLVKSQQKQKQTAALAKAVNTMSNATSLMIARDGSYGLNDSTMWAEIADGMPQKLEHSDIRWLTLKQAKEYPFCPADTIFLERLSAL